MSKHILKIVIASLIIIILGVSFYPLFIKDKSPLLILNMWNNDELPRNFRMTSDPIAKKEGKLPALTGLDQLNASGSAQFSAEALQAVLKKIAHPNVSIVDLRQESHGFIDGIAVSWYGEHDLANLGKSLSQIQQDERQRLRDALDQIFILVYWNRKFPFPLFVKSAETEADITKNHEVGYLRLPVADHMRPVDAIVDEFVRFISSIPKKTWIHFHCAAGEGRTTTFLAMYDMLHNAGKVSFDDIIRRQQLLGGIDLKDINSSKDWKVPYIKERLAFLEQFYRYSLDNSQSQQLWSSWLQQHQPKEAVKK